MMTAVDPNDSFQGTIVIVAPHMDDEALACGGLIARLAQKESIHIIYATDGMKSPSPVLPGSDSISPDLGEVRMRESTVAMRFLGIPGENLHFLRLPEANLKETITALSEMLLKTIGDIQANTIFIPFRFDRHPDHLAINQVITNAHKQGLLQTQLVEYFVYYRWRLLPSGDIRSYILPECLVEIDIADVSKEKRLALDSYKSQTTIYYSWQTRPILTPVLLDEECHRPELFLIYDSSLPGTAILSKAIIWIKFAHRLEPVLQKWKYLVGASLKRAFQKYVLNTG